VEIGAEKGLNTKNLLAYCRQRNARLTSVDCIPCEEISVLRDMYHDCFTLYDKPSLDVLPEITGYEVIIIDGDHNWYTVYHELKTIEKTSSDPGRFPLVLFHDVAWPYGRRDMYYDPERIPDAFRHNYAKKGMIPGRSELTSDCEWWNNNLCNATMEGGVQNGVLTAIEDFIKESYISFRLALFKGYNGIGFLATQCMLKRFEKLGALLDNIDWAVPIGSAMENAGFELVHIQEEHRKVCLQHSLLTEQHSLLLASHNALITSRTFRTMEILKRIASKTGILTIIRAVLFLRRRMINVYNRYKSCLSG
jgi:hypothetical protein